MFSMLTATSTASNNTVAELPQGGHFRALPLFAKCTSLIESPICGIADPLPYAFIHSNNVRNYCCKETKLYNAPTRVPTNLQQLLTHLLEHSYTIKLLQQLEGWGWE